MKAWEEIVNKALLGSEKAPLTAADLPAAIADEFEFSASADKEEDFLKISAMTYQFRQSGVLSSSYLLVAQHEAADESKPYCSSSSTQVLKIILDEDLPLLLKLWLSQCVSKKQLAHPEIIPVLLDIAVTRKELRKLIVEIAGRRGEWLGTLNPQWNFFAAETDPKTIWDNGTPEERKELLRQVRSENAEEAATLLETTWTTEGANEKAAFLEILKINLSEKDLLWLESLKEKGQRVNAVIQDLLKSIPSSKTVREYQDVLATCISIKTGKALLGMLTKTELVINESVGFPESIFKTGIEKLSSDKKVSDNQYILVQLITFVPPSFWSQHLQQTSDEVVELIQKEKRTAFYLPAVAMAAARFKDTAWIKVLLDKADKDIIGSSIVTMLTALPDTDRDKYALKFFEEQPAEIIHAMASSEKEWSLDLTKKILKHVAGEVYQYNKPFYRSVAALMPVAILDQLDSSTPDEEQRKTYWKNQRDELARLLTIKQQTLQSFNP